MAAVAPARNTTEGTRNRTWPLAAFPAAALIVVKAGVCWWTLRAGFSHVSDDDYARVTIAEAFAHAPRLDPSGTSWLPFPFWLNGVAMALVGRSLAVAEAVAIASAIVGTLLVYRALLRVGMPRWTAWLGVALATSAPWSAWLGVAMVPEALTACLIAVAALSITRPERQLSAAGGLLAACLSRYEAWPVALVFGAACVLFAWRRPVWRSSSLAAGAIALAGPLVWIAWNADAHGDAFHFVARVAAYRLRVAPPAGELRGVWLYPNAVARAGPGALLLLAVGAPALWFDRPLRRRWAGPAVAMMALVIFLVEGELHDGAPTHHPERALIALFWLATAFGVDGCRSLAVRFAWGRPKREAWLVGMVAAIGVAWGLAWPSRVADHPARSSAEDRASLIARGSELRARGVPHMTVTPCAYEHFALIAAYGAPERVTIGPPGPASGCPVVTER